MNVEIIGYANIFLVNPTDPPALRQVRKTLFFPLPLLSLFGIINALYTRGLSVEEFKHKCFSSTWL